MEQSIIEHEQVMESQNAKINEIEKALEDSNKLLQDNAMLEILRGSEWN